jgi:two-component system, OmpR family, lantibiotic biosynthesis sensor histidine kinase NisK/SpaK
MGALKRSFHNMPIIVSFMIVMIGAGLIATILSVVMWGYTADLAINLEWSYYQSGTIPYNEIKQEDGNVVREYHPGQDIVDYFTPTDKLLYYGYYALPYVLVSLIGICTLIGVPLLFYKLKLRKPMEIMISASEKISNQDLDFEIKYDSKDEMGQLCHAFEKMRTSLDKNNREMWRAMEERKKLNAAFSHDLRTPLTVLRGYTDFLAKYMPVDKVPQDKVISTIKTMNGHILRLENYVASMNSIQRLEEIEVEAQSVPFEQLCSRVKETAGILCKDKRLEFTLSSSSTVVNVDLNLVMQAFENLISNAVQYAKQTISVTCVAIDDTLKVVVVDDGTGFSDDALHNATKPFFRDQKETDKDHTGMGLHICNIICEKHGGQLIIHNSPDGGAEVSAIFKYTK